MNLIVRVHAATYFLRARILVACISSAGIIQIRFRVFSQPPAGSTPMHQLTGFEAVNFLKVWKRLTM